MTTHTKRYKAVPEGLSKSRQLSSLFNIISSNLLLATEVLSSDYRIKAVQELESLSRKARILAKELMSSTNEQSKEGQVEKISFLKQRMLVLVIGLIEEIGKLEPNKKTSQKTIADMILAKRLLRDSQRGLSTI